ncbi:MAG TPA: hypothetical protein VEH57_08565 [Thermoplasmata archaeon]|nr:hypothetical protein [Thermoplasmata archaeon]
MSSSDRGIGLLEDEITPSVLLPFYAEIREESTAVLQNRNQFIEWTFAILGALLVGAAIAYPVSHIAAWGLTALVVLLVGRQYESAVRNHRAWRRLCVLHEHLQPILVNAETTDSTPRYRAHVKNVFGQILTENRTPERKRSLYWNVAKMGFLYIVIVSAASFLLASYFVLSEFWGTAWWWILLLLAFLLTVAELFHQLYEILSKTEGFERVVLDSNCLVCNNQGRTRPSESPVSTSVP